MIDTRKVKTTKEKMEIKNMLFTFLYQEGMSSEMPLLMIFDIALKNHKIFLSNPTHIIKSKKQRDEEVKFIEKIDKAMEELKPLIDNTAVDKEVSITKKSMLVIYESVTSDAMNLKYLKKKETQRLLDYLKPLEI